jgi:hypothetical protein
MSRGSGYSGQIGNDLKSLSARLLQVDGAPPFEIISLAMSVLVLAIFGIWEYRATQIPSHATGIWTAPSFATVILVVLLSFISNGIFSLVLGGVLQLLRDKSILQFGIEWTLFEVVTTSRRNHRYTYCCVANSSSRRTMDFGHRLGNDSGCECALGCNARTTDLGLPSHKI